MKPCHEMSPSELTDYIQERFGSSCLDVRSEAYELARFFRARLNDAHMAGLMSRHSFPFTFARQFEALCVEAGIDPDEDIPVLQFAARLQAARAAVAPTLPAPPDE